MSNLISVQDLRVAFRMGKTGTVEAVKGVSFDIPVTAPWHWWVNQVAARASVP